VDFPTPILKKKKKKKKGEKVHHKKKQIGQVSQSHRRSACEQQNRQP